MSTVKERPILFSAPMVWAILAGRKTQTRRVMKGGPFWTHLHVTPVADSLLQFVDDDSFWVQLPKKDDDFTYATGVLTDQGRRIRCPYGKRGDRLWVRETFYDDISPRDDHDLDGIYYRADGNPGFEDPTPIPWKPSIYMPRWASRITLEITDVRVQRLQEMSHADALAEGITADQSIQAILDRERTAYTIGAAYHAAFADLWDSLNESTCWDSNPWVWVVTFKQVQP